MTDKLNDKSNRYYCWAFRLPKDLYVVKVRLVVPNLGVALLPLPLPCGAEVNVGHEVVRTGQLLAKRSQWE